IEHYANEIIAYTKKVLKHFYENYLLDTLRIFIWSFTGTKLVMKFSGGDIHQGEHGINKDFHTLYSFSFIRFLSHWVFPGKVLTTQCCTHVNIHRILCYAWLCTLFPFDQFLSHWVFTGRFLTRHIPYHLWSPRGSVVKDKVEPTHHMGFAYKRAYPSL
ncbi:receptor kinase 3, partial [Prunus dulcis]